MNLSFRTQLLLSSVLLLLITGSGISVAIAVDIILDDFDNDPRTTALHCTSRGRRHC